MSDVISSIIAECPGNIFTCLRQVFRQNINPTNVGASYLNQMYALSGLLALSLVISLFTLGIRFYKRSFRLVNKVKGYILPHYSVAWTICSVFLLATVQGFIWSRIEAAKGRNPSDLARWVLLPWIPAILGFYFAAYSLLVSHLIHKKSLCTTTSMFLSPNVINVLGLGLPVIFIINIAIVVALAESQFRVGLNDYIQLDNTFATAEEQWNQFPFNPLPLIMSEADNITSVQVRLNEFLKWFKWTFVSYLIWGVSTEIFLLVVGALHLRVLKRGIQTMKNGAALYGDGKLSREEKQLNRKYKSLVIVTIILGIVTTCFNANFIFIVSTASDVLSNTVYFEISTLLPLYLFAVGGLPLSIYMLHQVIIDKSISRTDSDLTRVGSIANHSLVDNAASTSPYWTSPTSPPSTLNHTTPSRSSSYKYNEAREDNFHQPTTVQVVELQDLNRLASPGHHSNYSATSEEGGFGFDKREEWTNEGLERERDFGYAPKRSPQAWSGEGRASVNRDNWI